MTEPRLLGNFAHPDDEGVMGEAFLQYTDAGVDTGLICATRGEAGEIADPALATAENLGEVREAELRCAAEVLAIDDLWLLPFRDSGMAGTPENGDPRAFVQADPTLVMRDLVSIIRDFRPDVVVTFDPSGAYGHPDQMAICRYTRMAFEAAADAAQFPDRGEPHAVSKLDYTSFPRSVIQRLAEWMRSQNYQGPFSALDPDTLGVPDELSTFVWKPSRGTKPRTRRGRCTARSRIAPASWRRCPRRSAASGAPRSAISSPPRVYDWGRERVIESRDHLPGPEVWLLARRSVNDPTEIAYYLAWAPAETTLATLARVAATGYTVEQCIEEAKGEVWFDHYEVRFWPSWHRHITLAMMAHAWLASLPSAEVLKKGWSSKPSQD